MSDSNPDGRGASLNRVESIMLESEARIQDRFVGQGKAITFPGEVIRVARCVQDDFRPSMSVADECAANEVGFQSAFETQELDAIRKYTEDDAYLSINESMRSYSHKKWENTIYYMCRGLRSIPNPPGRRPTRASPQALQRSL